MRGDTGDTSIEIPTRKIVEVVGKIDEMFEEVKRGLSEGVEKKRNRMIDTRTMGLMIECEVWEYEKVR